MAGIKSSADSSPGKTILIVVIAVLAVAAAIFSITRTVRSSQGRNLGSMGGFASKRELMQQQGEEPPQAAMGGKGAPSEGPPGAGMEAPPGGPSLGGKASGR